ncbi:MAG: DUF1287 domain-containing protein [Coprobacillus cateniformis]|nr:DUF1287 domain-containing protein [Coprobacillus cateniformis]
MINEKKYKVGLIFILAIVLLFVVYVLYFFNYIPHQKYSNSDFNITTYKSSHDEDDDGIYDQTAILNNVKAYISSKPKYKSKYYGTGYPDDHFGVCSDVVAFGLKDAGYDIDIIDKNINFRRVQNLEIYFKYNAQSLTTDIHRIEECQGGDIVIFENHIGIVSDHRNKNGVSFVIHHASPYQRYYEEDILEYRNDIVGHYRIN